MTEITIQDALRGCTTGRKQTSGIMQVIPLVSDLECDAFAVPSEVLISTTHYGKMSFRNPTDRIVLVPANATYLTAKAAQDHAMSVAGFVPGRKAKTYSNAMCVEQTQGGYIPEGQYRLSILPMSLREDALAKRQVESYGKLWESITRLKQEAKVTSGRRGGHLADFFAAFDRQLDQFVAEFERVPGMVGAVILIGGRVIGIERAPSRAYWDDVWEPLVRTCYAAEAIRQVQMGKGVTPRTTQVRAARDLDDLAAALAEAREADDAEVRTTVRSLVQDAFEVATEESQGPFSLAAIENPQFVGQIVREGPQVHYLSVISRRSFEKHAKWHTAREFAI